MGRASQPDIPVLISQTRLSGKDARPFGKIRAGTPGKSFLKNIRKALDFGFRMCYVTGNETGTFSIPHTPTGDLDSRIRGNDREERAFIK